MLQPGKVAVLAIVLAPATEEAHQLLGWLVPALVNQDFVGLHLLVGGRRRLRPTIFVAGLARRDPQRTGALEILRPNLSHARQMQKWLDCLVHSVQLAQQLWLVFVLRQQTYYYVLSRQAGQARRKRAVSSLLREEHLPFG